MSLNTANPRDDSTPLTRDRLIQEALKLLSREGLNGVSLRRIVQASGAANPSALHYHFGDRKTLVREITLWLQQWIEPRACERLSALNATGPDACTVRAVLVAAFSPVTDMLNEPGLGLDAVRFIARLGWDFGHEGQELSAQMHKRSITMAFSLLHTLMPHLDEEVLKFRLITNMNAVYNGIAYRSYLRRSPFGPLDLSKNENTAQLEKVFFDFLEAGIKH